MITTTLNRIRAHGPCREGWEKLLKGLGKTTADDEPLPFARIVEINGLDDALWCCRAEPQHAREWRLFTVWCARQVRHLMTDERSITALDVAERHANGQATDEELAAAWDAAREAAWDAAREAARSAAAAAAREAARPAADAAAWADTRDDAWDAAWDAAWAAARAVAWADARAAAWAAWAARDAQKTEFLRVVGGVADEG